MQQKQTELWLRNDLAGLCIECLWSPPALALSLVFNFLQNNNTIMICIIYCCPTSADRERARKLSECVHENKAAIRWDAKIASGWNTFIFNLRARAFLYLSCCHREPQSQCVFLLLEMGCRSITYSLNPECVCAHSRSRRPLFYTDIYPYLIVKALKARSQPLSLTVQLQTRKMKYEKDIERLSLVWDRLTPQIRIWGFPFLSTQPYIWKCKR